MTIRHHLAQVNIARAKAPLDTPTMKGFVDQLDHINQLAEMSPGFVWRLQTEDGDATALQIFEDPLIIVNMSVWESYDALKDYVYSGDHLTVLRNKKNWFEKPDAPILALWWVPAGQLPTLESAKLALATLRGKRRNAGCIYIRQAIPRTGKQHGSAGAIRLTIGPDHPVGGRKMHGFL